jgi:hypothetical protein
MNQVSAHAHAIHPAGKTFHRIVDTAILANFAVMLWPLFDELHENLAEHLDTALVVFFLLELAVRFAADGFSVKKFFGESPTTVIKLGRWRVRVNWNQFDTAIILLALVPLLLPVVLPFLNTSLLRVMRLARVTHGMRHAPHLHRVSLRLVTLLRVARLARLVHGLRHVTHLRLGRFIPALRAAIRRMATTVKG